MKALVLIATLAALLAGTMAASAAPKKHYWRLVDRTLAANWTGSYAGLSFGYGWGRSSAAGRTRLGRRRPTTTC
jgi:opacity protein-like surface antigen